MQIYVSTGLLAPQISYGESHATDVEIEASARDAAIRCIHQCLGVCGPSCSNPRELAECCHRHHTEVNAYFKCISALIWFVFEMVNVFFVTASARAKCHP